MKSDSTKAMQEVLQAAVSRMNGGQGESPATPADPLGVLMAVIPKLLQDKEAGEELLEKLENLQKDDIGQLRKQVQVLRKQCHRLLKSQEEMLLELREMRKQQTTVSRAVLELARNMERIELIDVPSSEEEDYAQDDDEHGRAPLSGSPERRRFSNDAGRMRQKVPRNPNRERP